MAVDEATPQWHRDDAIKTWQAAADASDEATISTGLIGSLFDCIMSVLKYLLDDLNNRRLVGSPHSESQYDSLESISSSLFFWGSDFGVSRGDLDESLQHSDLLRETVLAVLNSIAQHTSRNLISILTTVKERREILSSSNIKTIIDHVKGVLDEPEEVDKGDLENIGEIFQALQTKVETLGILSNSLECPAKDRRDSEEARNWTGSQDRAADQYYVDLVNLRFPLADKALVEKLGKSNWSRYKHIQKQREWVQKEPQVLLTDTSKSEFHDSGIGSSGPAQSVFTPRTSPTSYRTQSEYASSVVSSRAEASHKRLPPLPEKGRSGEPFVCEVCDKLVKIRRTKEWKRHVFGDICAYTCIFNHCSFAGVLFEDREAMTNHLELQHGIEQDAVSQVCPLCLDKVSGGRDLISFHFARHLEEIALTVLPTSAGSENGSDKSESDTEEAVVADIAPDNFSDVSVNEPTDSQESEKHPEEDNSKITGGFLKPTLVGTHVCGECGVTVAQADMRKHMERHVKPYGCTYPRCNERLSSKADWREHENHAHFQLEAFRCGLNPGFEKDEVCGAYFTKLGEFKDHLASWHGETDPESLRSEIKQHHIEKNHQGRFWCGFCQWMIIPTTQGEAACNERFDHIAHHFEREGKVIEEWLCVETNKVKAHLIYNEKAVGGKLPVPVEASPSQTQELSFYYVR